MTDALMSEALDLIIGFFALGICLGVVVAFARN